MAAPTKNTKNSRSHEASQPKTEQAEHRAAIDPIALSHALSSAMERMLPLLQNYMETNGKQNTISNFDPLMALQERFSAFMGVFLSNPKKLAELQMAYVQQWASLWQNTLKKMAGEQTDDLYKPQPGDRRFHSQEWNENLLFDFIKQSYLMTSDWMQSAIHATEGLDKDTREQVEFYTRQMSNAMAPTNFVMTNPEVLRETIRTGGENLVRGLENLVTDMERGQGELKISTTNLSAFKIGENLATTKGSVVYQNDLLQIIQYAPTTKECYKTPLVIVPPFINKYYILDMRPDNSFVKWMVDQGHTVFMVSWVNPDASHADKGLNDFIREGILDTLEQVKKITGEKKANVISYCIGGTLLACTLAWLKARGDESPIKSITFLTTLIDFENAGELKLFTDEKQIAAMEKDMKAKGVLNGSALQKTFSLLRANDMIWSFVINNYLMGREPFPFDLLYWNQDSTNLPYAIHSFYLRKMYLENKLIEPDGLEIEGTKIDIRSIDTPAYFLSTREDHIAPWKATFSGYQALQSHKRFVLSGSGHIAGVVNPPTSNKYGYWINDKNEPNADKWLEHAAQHKGSWWVDWQEWALAFTGPKVPARSPEHGLEPAPGSYVQKRT